VDDGENLLVDIVNLEHGGHPYPAQNSRALQPTDVHVSQEDMIGGNHLLNYLPSTPL